jgi:hypothetical protein
VQEDGALNSYKSIAHGLTEDEDFYGEDKHPTASVDLSENCSYPRVERLGEMFEEQPQMTEEMWLHGTPFSLNEPGRYFNMVAVRDFTTDLAGKEKYVVAA